MFNELIERLRAHAKSYEDMFGEGDSSRMMVDAADAIEDLNRQRDRAYARLCEWCGVCPEGKRNPEDCEIAALNPEPPKEEN